MLVLDPNTEAHRYVRTVQGASNAAAIAAQFVADGQSIYLEPYPFDEWHIVVGAENSHILGALIASLDAIPKGG